MLELIMQAFCRPPYSTVKWLASRQNRFLHTRAYLLRVFLGELVESTEQWRLRMELQLVSPLVFYQACFVKGSSIETRWLEVGYYSDLWFRTAKRERERSTLGDRVLPNNALRSSMAGP